MENLKSWIVWSNGLEAFRAYIKLVLDKGKVTLIINLMDINWIYRLNFWIKAYMIILSWGFFVLNGHCITK